MEILFDSQKQFEVVTYWADQFLLSKMFFYDLKNLLSRLEDPELSDARCLTRMIQKEVDEFNSKIRTKRKLLSKLRYKTRMTSNLFTGMPIPAKQIERLIEENPDKDSYEIFRLLK